MNRKSILSIIILVIFISNVFSILGYVKATPYETTDYNTSYTITASSDDAYYLLGYEFSNNSTLGYLKSSSYDCLTGFRFDNIVIPSDAVITHAYISLYSSDEIDEYSYQVKVYGVDDDDYGTFTNSGTLTGATQTTSLSNWDMKDLEGGAWKNTTDLKSIVQEIYNRVGWSSGNAMAFIVASPQSAHGNRAFRTYDYTATTYDPKLYISYTVTEEITSTNPWDSVDNNDNHILLNDTEGWSWWEVWNSTSNDIIHYTTGVNSVPPWVFRTIQTDDTDSIVRSCNLAPQTIIYSFIASYNGVLYIASANSTRYGIYHSHDNGDTWSEYYTRANHAGQLTASLGLGIDTNGIIHICLTTVEPHLVYLSYNITAGAIKTNPTEVAGGTVNRVNMYVSQGIAGKIWCLVSGSDYLTLWTKDSYAGAWSSTAVLTSYGTLMFFGCSQFFEDGVGNIWCLAIFGSGYAPDMTICAKVIKSDKTLLATETVSGVGGTHAVAIFVSVSSAHNDDTVYISFALKTTYSIHTTYRNSANMVFGTWSHPADQSFDGTVTAMGYDTGWEANSFYLFNYDSVDTTHIKGYKMSAGIYSLDKTWTTNIKSVTGTWTLIKYAKVGAEGEHQYILTDPEGNIVEDGIIPDYISYPLNFCNATYDNFLFEGEVYRFSMYVNNSDITHLYFNDTVHTITLSYNNNTDVYGISISNANGTLVNQLVAGLISSGKTDYSNITNIWWKFILNTNIVDCINRDLYYLLEYTDENLDIVMTDSGRIDANITIYNIGGLIEYTSTGDGGHVVGGHPFELYATNSTLNSTARADIIYRRLQGVHMLVELDTDNKVEAGEDYFEVLSNVGYYEAGIDYKFEGNETDAWIEGWMVRVYVDDVRVGDMGLTPDDAYVRLRVYWYNRGNLVRGDEEIYSYHFGYDKDAFPSPRTSFTFWCDLWFDKANSSTVFGGRVNPQYFGYYEAGSAWWFNSNFRPLISNATSSMLFDDITDENGNIISSKEISLVRVYSIVAKTANAGDLDTYTVKPFQVMKMQLAKERMEGIDTPDYIETQQLDIAGYGMYNILGGLGTLLSNSFFSITRMMIGAIDTFLSFFGLPYGTFSSLMNYISASFSNLMAWLASASAVFANILQIFTQLVTSISSIITYVITTIIFFSTDILTIPLQIIQLIVAVLNGSTIIFYGISLDFTPYKDLMDGLKQLLPVFGSMMFGTWLLFGNITFEGEPDIVGFIGRVRMSFDWIRDTYNSLFWVFDTIYDNILFIYAWVKSHIPTLGGTPSSAP